MALSCNEIIDVIPQKKVKVSNEHHLLRLMTVYTSRQSHNVFTTGLGSKSNKTNLTSAVFAAVVDRMWWEHLGPFYQHIIQKVNTLNVREQSKTTVDIFLTLLCCRQALLTKILPQRKGL